MPELQCLILILEHLPYQEIVAQPESRRVRNDYPIRALFRTMIAGVVFGHDSVNLCCADWLETCSWHRFAASTHCHGRARRNKCCTTMSRARCRRSPKKSSRFVRHCPKLGIFHVFSNSCPSWKPTPAWSLR